MFSATAAKAAVEMDSSEVPVSAEKPQGAYSCTLKEAGGLTASGVCANSREGGFLCVFWSCDS